MKSLFIFFLVLVVAVSQGQELTGSQLLEKAIEFHDPEGNWTHFKGTFKITMKTPSSGDRVSKIQLDLAKEEFNLAVVRGDDSYAYHIKEDSCSIALNGSSKISTEDSKRLRLSCERGGMMKNYYTYLYGLPMKLKNPGTIINEKIERKIFKNKEYLVIKVNYDEKVGKDTWYFYFDPTTYAMEVYQFYHDETKNDGEYILLEGIETVNDIKMPKTRAWYYNKDDKYLGTDDLSKN